MMSSVNVLVLVAALILPASGSYVYLNQKQQAMCDNYAHALSFTTYNTKQKIELLETPRGDFTHCDFRQTIETLNKLEELIDVQNAI